MNIEKIISKQYPTYKINSIEKFTTLNEFGVIIKKLYNMLIKDKKFTDMIERKYRYFLMLLKNNKLSANDFIFIMSKDLRNRIIYTHEPKQIEVFNINPEKVLYKMFQADCDDLALITAVIIKNIFPTAQIELFLTSHVMGRIPHHAYTKTIINGKEYILDLVRRKNKRKKIFQKLTFRLN